MVAMAAIENAPLATPKKITLALMGQGIAKMAVAERDKPTVARADSKQPPHIQTCREPRRPATQRELATATDSMPTKTPMWCHPESCVVWPGDMP